MTQPDFVVDTSARGLAQLLLKIISEDRPRFDVIDRYVFGDHDNPYMPAGADEEYRLLAKRAVTNLIPLLIGTPAQALFVDSFRRGSQDASKDDLVAPPEWNHWQASRLDARQGPIYDGALKYGHSFTLTEQVKGRVLTKGLSAYNTAAVYEDPANDIDPYAALTIVREAKPDAKTPAARRGLARLWDGIYEYRVTFLSPSDLESVSVGEGVPHGGEECPVTRFAASMDLEGRTTGLVEPNIANQDRINQTMFDLLVAQTYGSFKIRTVTGMAPPMKRWTQAAIEDGQAPEGTEAGDPVIDPETGRPVPEPVNLNARRFFFAADKDTKFDTLDGTSLEGYIKSLDMSLRHIAVITQTPPHYLLGEIANLSAEALQAAETALLRKVETFRKSFGESWERVFRIAGVLSGDSAAAADYAGEVVWRDTQMRSLSRIADGLVKLKDLGIPGVGLWGRVPEATRTEIQEWMRLREEELARLKADRAELIAAGAYSAQDQVRIDREVVE
ncbi:phage portal protein [Micromonospora sp. NBC_01813]|uniref:phage portal protein n=1 Tax=Micromonospora sp. NBC_01813 TaxID=2975988 RepID=UPI002DDA4458|nr:phage portal protein [Micromonospora sp. NBC_01813]WSA11544.1 phage portal protein [Micromonospora sp. NBC_01813]